MQDLLAFPNPVDEKAARVVAGVVVVESTFGICLSCNAFGAPMRAGVVPRSVCEERPDISGRLGIAG